MLTLHTYTCTYSDNMKGRQGEGGGRGGAQGEYIYLYITHATGVGRRPEALGLKSRPGVQLKAASTR